MTRRVSWSEIQTMSIDDVENYCDVLDAWEAVEAGGAPEE